jgi:lipoprotein-releasing system ATP-binding protein
VPRGSIPSTRFGTSEDEMAEEAEDVPVIYLHEIKREYRQGEATLTILNGAKLALWAGQSVALVAPSGSGKSTLLHIAGLLESPDDGEVYGRGHCRPRNYQTLERTQIRAPNIGFVYHRTGCCRNSPRSKTSCCRRMIRGPQTFERPDQAFGGDPGLSRPRRPHHALGRPKLIRRRTAARRHRARGRQMRRGRCCADEPTGILDPHTIRITEVQGADAAGEGDAGRDADRHPQHGTRPAGWTGGSLVETGQVVEME